MTLVRQIDVDSYGLSYLGSKNKYVKRMPRILRPICIDLFGGGGAISHYLARHGADRVIFNDKSKVCAEVFSAALRGDFQEKDLMAFSSEERLRLARENSVIQYQVCFKPTSVGDGVFAKKEEFDRRINRFRRVRNAGIANKIAIVSADYSAFEAMRPSPDVAWYIDPPYRDVGGYAMACDFSWRWCDEIVGPVVGFDSRLPEGECWRELWRIEQRMTPQSRYYTTVCFFRPARDPTEADVIATAEQLNLTGVNDATNGYVPRKF